MKTSLRVLSLVSLIAAQSAVSEIRLVKDTSTRCADLIKECFAYGPNERSTCFYTAAHHPFCNNTKLAELAMERWAISPVGPAPDDKTSALLGTELVDNACVDNFDNSWSSLMVNGEMTKEDFASLSSSLERCRASQPVDISRP